MSSRMPGRQFASAKACTIGIAISRKAATSGSTTSTPASRICVSNVSVSSRTLSFSQPIASSRVSSKMARCSSESAS